MIRAIRKRVLKYRVETIFALLAEDMEGAAMNYAIEKRFSPTEWHIILDAYIYSGQTDTYSTFLKIENRRARKCQKSAKR